VRVTRAAVLAILVLGGLPAAQGQASAQDGPSQTAVNEVTFVGNWEITWESGDGDDYWLIFLRPGQTVRLNVDEEQINFRITEAGTWKMRVEIEDRPDGCDAVCDPAPIRFLQQDPVNPNRWRLGLTKNDNDSDLDLILDRIVPLEVNAPAGGDFGVVQVNTVSFRTVTVKNIGADPIDLPGANDCPEASTGTFIIEGNLPFTLRPGEMRSFVVRFNPQFTGPKQCPISFTADRTPFFLFTGRGIPATNTLSVSLNGTSFTAGQTMAVTATLTPLTTPATADAYVVVQLPTGQLFSVQAGGTLVPGIVPIASGIVPVAYSATLAQYEFTGAEPQGTYSWYSVLTRPGTLTFIGPLQQTTFMVR
jgi:hypothetical protein